MDTDADQPDVPEPGESYAALFERTPQNFTGPDARAIEEFFGSPLSFGPASTTEGEARHLT